MRSIWKGSISFGLINIPVKIYTAIQESSLDLDMLDSNDHSNIKFKTNAQITKDKRIIARVWMFEFGICL